MTARSEHRSEPAQAGPSAPVMSAAGRKPTVVVDGLHVVYKIYASPPRRSRRAAALRAWRRRVW